MKRCPQCEFIYEDDQSLCDMDGVLLVLDSRNLPNLHALATVTGPAPKAQKRNRTVPAFATLILALVLGMVYFVTQRSAASYTSASSTNTIEPVLIPDLPVPTPIETPSPEKIAAPKPVETKSAVVVPAKKSATTKTVSTQTKPPAEKKKDDSKVGSILKKTGRILKKPFKF